MDLPNMSGLEYNVTAVIIAQILADGLSDDETTLLASFLYTVADCMNTIIDAQAAGSSSQR